MSNKTISINPSLFSLNGGAKTKKNREKKQTPTKTPLISPNVLKNKLLKRIKEHKQRETENLENNKKKLTSDDNNKKDKNIKDNESSTFTDEFSESINYLQTLSKQKKINDEKTNYELQKQKRREELNRSTLKNLQQVNTASNQSFVNLELPEELKINTEQFISGTPITVTPYPRDTIPYGILKGGNKPTYRDWNRTQRNNIVTNPNAALTIEGILNKDNNERENRLNKLREKLKNKQLEDSLQKNEDIMMTQNLIQKPNSEIVINNVEPSVFTEPNISNKPNITTTNITSNQGYNSSFNNTIMTPSEKIIAIKKIIKKTIKRKYTLGKSKTKPTVGILVKDRGTRKKILNAQKDLRRKSINDIKTYLRDHNLIKIGSNAPNDVLRKLYESAMLAGEITNSNSETLLHNFSKDEKEL
jgi:hypothetical protein